MSTAQFDIAIRPYAVEARSVPSVPFAYWTTIFLSAFLLFSLQLVIGKYLLPWFGGTPAMWTTCMFFFQVLLLAGYSYAHALASHCSVRFQTGLHSLVLAPQQCFSWAAWPFAGVCRYYRVQLGTPK
jgi:hypothetical protein